MVVLEMDRAVTEWKRLEPPAIGHERPQLHEFFGRTRTCLAIMDQAGSQAAALCWVGPDGQIGPAVGRTPEELVPVVLQALDRVASSTDPESLGVFCATDAGGCSAPARPRLPRVVAELDDEQRPAAGPRPLPADPSHAAALAAPMANLQGVGELASTALKKLLAVGVLLLAAWLLFKLVLGFVATIAWILVAVLAVVAVIWALRVL